MLVCENCKIAVGAEHTCPPPKNPAKGPTAPYLDFSGTTHMRPKHIPTNQWKGGH